MDPMTLMAMSGLLSGGGTGEGSGVSPIAALAGAPAELFKAGLGVYQGLKARKIRRDYKRPEFEIPGAVREAVGQARGMALDPRLPGQGLIEEQIGLSEARTGRDIREMGAGSAERMAALTGASRGGMEQRRQLGVAAAQQQQQDMMNLQNMLGQLGEWQFNKWRYEKDQPYQEAMAAAQRLGDAANTNIFGAMEAGGGLLTSTMGTQGGGAQRMAPPVSSPGVPAMESRSPGLMPDISGTGRRSYFEGTEGGYLSPDEQSRVDALFQSGFQQSDPLGVYSMF